MEIIIIICEDMIGLSAEHLFRASLEPGHYIIVNNIDQVEGFVGGLFHVGLNNLPQGEICLNHDDFHRDRQEPINLVIEARYQSDPFDFSFEPVKENKENLWKK